MYVIIIIGDSMKKKNGFTLIELLAVIIILGILMIIAIPSVTRYISDSRKAAYVDTAKEIVGGARNLVNEGKLEMYDTDTTYYIESSCIKTENASKSPYGEFTKAYVVVTYDGKRYTYYWTSNDDAGQGIKNIIRVDKLDIENIESDLKDTDISTLRGIDGRSKTVVVSDANGCKKEGANDAKIPIDGDTGEQNVFAIDTIETSAQEGNQFNRIGETDIYIFKGGTNNPPANYVKFNNEDWRIIGIYGNRIKIQRVATIPNLQFYTAMTTNVWRTSYLKTYLNTTYYDTLSAESKAMIDDTAEWNTGDTKYKGKAYETYNYATSVKWKGIDTGDPGIALMASYEYQYASNGSGCLETTGFEYNNNGCGSTSKNWLRPSTTSWTISPVMGPTHYRVIHIYNGYTNSDDVDHALSVAPAVFLKSTVKLASNSGNGTSTTDAYIFKQ